MHSFSNPVFRVRAVIGAPTHDALKVATVVEVFLVELATRRHVVGQELPLERGPAWRVHAGVDTHRRIGSRRRLPRQAGHASQHARKADEKSGGRLHVTSTSSESVQRSPSYGFRTLTT
jgi:hypothetical protein